MKAIDRIRKMMLSRHPAPPDPESASLAEELRARVAGVPMPDPLSASSAAEAEWLGNRRRLRELIDREDPRRFLSWDVIAKTMFVGDFPFVRTELAELRADPGWPTRWARAIKEDPVGAPARSRWKLDSSGNLIHHAYSVWTFEKTTGTRVDQLDTIVEFGGGYGSFCRLVHRLGFKGRYVIADLPEFSALQSYFLRSIGIPARHATPGAPAQEGVTLLDNLGDLAGVLGSTSPLFIALWSLSETPVSLRESLLRVVAGSRYYLIAFQDVFGEVDNKTYFAEFAASRPDLKWITRSMTSAPGNHYLIGKPR